MTMVRMENILCFIFYLIILTNGQYKDDADYNHEFYQDASIDYVQSLGDNPQNALQDDFYILNDIENAELQNDMYPDINDFSIAFSNDKNSLKRTNSLNNQLDWYKVPEKVYRYTKHRIPGYDYDEFDYFGVKSSSKVCDEKSIWTHCLCQFTCNEPNMVDCYTPCKSGCECKENYVFDDKQQQCLLPEECSSKQEDIIYNK
ncbi:PREDICTED: uncharacterized protein LOC107071608 [Polistes dominula]|uniref:Uncharacterized protein LOC107071608 n=1 Tax=Polistes dominula TaxID=743375 RepID=A0ABM1J190_POLDO|nr:PREDICTED: uncharacterized protein LOC107071608 [Polistes dominula]